MNFGNQLRPSQKPMRVAAYCRVSTDKDDQANSFENQQRYFKQFIEGHEGWELYQIFADEGISGTNTKKRRAFNQMISKAECGELDLIITKEISRFARNTLDSIYYTRKLKACGVGVIFMNDGIYTLDADAELRLAIMSSIAQEESRKTSERVKWGQKRQMEQGVVFGRSMLGYDVRGGQMYVNPSGAEIVKLIFHKFYYEEKGSHIIARELLEAGIQPMYAKRWQNTVILRILRNEKYCGDLVQKKTYTPDFLTHEKKYNRGQEDLVVLHNHHEPIIPRELFFQVQERLEANAVPKSGHSKHSSRYLLSGKIKCGCCGQNYVARYKKRKDHTLYKTWRCLEAVRSGRLHKDEANNFLGCSAPAIKNDTVLEILSDVLCRLSLGQTPIKDWLLGIIRPVLQMEAGLAQLQRLEGTVARFTEKRQKLMELYLSGFIDKDEFACAKQTLEQACATEEANLQHARLQHSSIEPAIEIISAAITQLLQRVKDEDEGIRLLLKQIVIGEDGTIDVSLNGISFVWRYEIEGAGQMTHF